jgi:hypothetical protein
MSKAYISKALRQRVREQARHRCGYCLSQERITGQPLDVDHIIPEARGGPTEEGNLWLMCGKCNQYKGDAVIVPDPLTGEQVPLFNPRAQAWVDHFAWSPEGDRIIGLTAIGRATVTLVKLNRVELVNARRLWVSVGWHPPKD